MMFQPAMSARQAHALALWLTLQETHDVHVQPVASTLEKLLGAPALLVPFGQSSDNCHLANERLQRVNLLRSKNVIKNLLLELEIASR